MTVRRYWPAPIRRCMRPSSRVEIASSTQPPVPEAITLQGDDAYAMCRYARVRVGSTQGTRAVAQRTRVGRGQLFASARQPLTLRCHVAVNLIQPHLEFGQRTQFAEGRVEADPPTSAPPSGNSRIQALQRQFRLSA